MSDAIDIGETFMSGVLNAECRIQNSAYRRRAAVHECAHVDAATHCSFRNGAAFLLHELIVRTTGSTADSQIETVHSP